MTVSSLGVQHFILYNNSFLALNLYSMSYFDIYFSSLASLLSLALAFPMHFLCDGFLPLYSECSILQWLIYCVFTGVLLFHYHGTNIIANVLGGRYKFRCSCQRSFYDILDICGDDLGDRLYYSRLVVASYFSY